MSSGLTWWFCENISLTKIRLPSGLRLFVPLTMTILFIVFQICLNGGTHRSDVIMWYLSNIAPEHMCLPFFLIDTIYGYFVISTSPLFCVISALAPYINMILYIYILYNFDCLLLLSKDTQLTFFSSLKMESVIFIIAKSICWICWKR